MNRLKRIIFLGGLLSATVFSGAHAVDFVGDMIVSTNNSDSSGFSGRPTSSGAPTGDNISVVSGGSLIVCAVTGGEVWVSDTFSIAKDFLHNGNPILVNDPTFHGQGSFAFIGDNSTVTAKKLQVGGDFVNGDGSSDWNLNLNVDTIEVTGTFTAEENSKLVIAPNDYSSDPSLSAGDLDIKGGLYMGDSAGGTDVVNIVSNSDDNVYKISTTGTLDVDGDINADKGKLVLEGGSIKVANDVLGNVDFDVDDLNVGNLVIDSNTALDWKDRFTNPGTGDLLGDGSLKSTGDILIGGSVNGELDIKGDADMWVGEDLLGYLGVEVDNLYVLGDINGSGNIKADEVNVGGDLIGGNGGLVIDAGSVNVDGDLSGDLNIDADEIHVNRDVLGGTKFRPNLPNNSPMGDAETQFHVNPNGSVYNGVTGKYDLFKQTDLTISGTYYFDNDSYLQLVLNSKTAASDGTAAYNPDTDDALITVGGFDASGVTSSPNFMDMDSTPNIEILIDNLDQTISKIRLIEVTGGGTINLGELDFAGLWFYWDNDNDGIADIRLFQETKLVADSNNIYAMVAMMNSIESLTRLSVDAGRNDIQVAAAVDDLILHRLHQYAGYTTDDLANYYTSVMRILFPGSDVYYDIMLNGGSYKDAVDVMVAENPDYALNFVRGIGIGSVAEIGNKLAVSARVSRNAVSDQLMEDFSWKRYHDKNIAWLRMGFGDEITSFNFGADTKVNKKIIAGFNFGYNSIDFGNLDGSTINLGLYGTYDLQRWGRAYANFNLAFHSADAKTNGLIVGEMKSDLSAVDTTLDVGLLHKIFDQYITGRGYVTIGLQGGYEVTQKYKGQDFMDLSADSRFVLAPGYEISLGKDIWFSVNSFMRPSLKLGIEYDLLGNGNRDVDFRFSEVNNWRTWQASDSENLWLRYGGQIDFSFIVGTNISIGYEVLKNGDFKANQFKLNGVYRF